MSVNCVRMSNVDSHQVVRGSCETKDCHCEEFVKGDNPKCAGCKHAPVKHKALSKGAAPVPVVLQEPADSQPNPPLIQPVQTAPTTSHQAPYPNQSMTSPPFQPSYIQPQLAANYSIPPNPGI